jgi:hypothetical protein
MGKLRATHTYSVLGISEAAFNEIKDKLEEAGYHHCFNGEGPDLVIDMAGVALQKEPSE